MPLRRAQQLRSAVELDWSADHVSDATARATATDPCDRPTPWGPLSSSLVFEVVVGRPAVPACGLLAQPETASVERLVEWGSRLSPPQAEGIRRTSNTPKVVDGGCADFTTERTAKFKALTLVLSSPIFRARSPKPPCDYTFV